MVLWLELEVERVGEDITVTARGSRGERAARHSLTAAFSIGRLRAFTLAIGRAVERDAPLSLRELEEAQALHDALFSGEVRDLRTRLSEASGAAPLLLRLLIQEPRLHAVPWEAALEPGSSASFLGTSPRLVTARAVASTRPWQPREVRRGVRVLLVSALPTTHGAYFLRGALEESIQSGAVEWSEPISHERARLDRLFETLRRIKCPHVLHFLGHGGLDRQRIPALRLTDDEDGEERWISVEAFAQEIEANMARELRLVYLEACAGARPGAFASAAEAFANRGTDAVVAHLWPVKAELARATSSAFYRALTVGGQLRGDVAASLQATRRLLCAHGAAAFSPVLYVRGAAIAPFDFEGRKLVPIEASVSTLSSQLAVDIDPALERLFETPFGLILDHGRSEEEAAGLQRFRASLERALKEAGDDEGDDLPLGALTQRYALYAGQGRLSRLFQRSLALRGELAIPPLLDALGAKLRPGVHVTLLWLPLLEHTLLRHHADRTIYVVQTGYQNSGEKRVVLVRRPGADDWEETSTLSDQLDLARDYVVLRLYGGYSPEEQPILTKPRITEDDFIQGLIEIGELMPPDWESQLMGWLRMHPVLCIGLSVLEWRHRMLLQWLFDYRAAPEGSVVLLGPDEVERRLWERQGASLPGRGRLHAVRCDFRRLANLINSITLSVAS